MSSSPPVARVSSSFLRFALPVPSVCACLRRGIETVPDIVSVMDGSSWALRSFCCSLSPSSILKRSYQYCGLSRTPCTRIDKIPPYISLYCPGLSCAISKRDATVSDNEGPSTIPSPYFASTIAEAVGTDAHRKVEDKIVKRRAERRAYLFAALASTAGITFLTVGAVYYRFTWQIQGTEIPLSEMFGTFSLAVGASVGMEYWARWAHRALWHDLLWSMHESHHRPREGPFETNDLFAIINAIPAIALMSYGFFHKGLIPGLCFGAGLGITMFGIAYMFVHDGLVHRRFPVGPIANVPYFQKVAAAHQLHHADRFKGVPYGLFLGPKELECEEGGAEELDKMLQSRKSKVN